MVSKIRSSRCRTLSTPSAAFMVAYGTTLLVCDRETMLSIRSFCTCRQATVGGVVGGS